MEIPTPNTQIEAKPSAASEPKEETIQQRSSVEVTRNSRGYNWKVKVYDDDANKAYAKMIELEKGCADKFGE